MKQSVKKRCRFDIKPTSGRQLEEAINLQTPGRLVWNERNARNNSWVIKSTLAWAIKKLALTRWSVGRLVGVPVGVGESLEIEGVVEASFGSPAGDRQTDRLTHRPTAADKHKIEQTVRGD